MLTRPHELFAKALNLDYAIGAFNFSNLEFAQAVVWAAEAQKSPVILATSEGAIEYGGLKQLAGITTTLADEATVPIALHLDHGKSLDMAKQCIEAGYTSVMIDLSKKDLESNIRITKEVVEYAHPRNVWVEAELGAILGTEGALELQGKKAPEDTMTKPEDVARFVAETKVDALAVDEGIPGFRTKTISDLKRFCKKHRIKLKIITFRQEFGKTLTDMLRLKENPCTVCGVLRRYLLNKHSRGYSKLVTGHNLDDEAQSVLMNLLRNNLALCARLGPKTGLVNDRRFTPRVKPLYFCTEKELAAYSLIMGLGVSFNECPYIATAFRARVRDMLDSNTKKAVIKWFLRNLPQIKRNCHDSGLPNACRICKEPAYGAVCSACAMQNKKF